MNILVTGANGQLGNEIRIVAKNSRDTYIYTDVVEVEGVETTLLDITSLEAVRKMVQEKNVKCIINCAAYTNVDKAETDEALCELLNAKAVENLAIAMKEPHLALPPEPGDRGGAPAYRNHARAVRNGAE